MRKQPNETTEHFQTRQQRRLAAVKTKDSKSTNPKRNPEQRRQRQNWRAFVPYVLLNIGEFRTKNYAGRKKQNPQMAINTGLIIRAHKARRNGTYHIFQESNKI